MSGLRHFYVNFYWTNASVDANKLWKAAGKPRHGSVYSARQSSRKRYRVRLRDKQAMESQSYTYDLHGTLLLKNGTTFWKCWQSKFEQTKKYTEVNGCAEAIIIAGIAQHFEKSYSCNNQDRADLLKQEYSTLRNEYSGLPLPDNVILTQN